MTQTDLENSNEEGEISDSSISDNESDLDKLRQMAILSMIKTEKTECVDYEIPICTVYDIEQKLKECRENIPIKINVPEFQINMKSSFIKKGMIPISKENILEEKQSQASSAVKLTEDLTEKTILRKDLIVDVKSTFINKCKRTILQEDILEVKRPKVSLVVKLVEDFIGKSISSNNFPGDMSRQPELKSKLFKILKKSQKESSSITNNYNGNSTYLKSTLITADNAEKNKIGSVSPNEVDVFDRYDSNINEESKSIDEITISIDFMMASIREKLQKSNVISSQIENFKRHKSDLHKEINETRSKIAYLNKIKKQKMANIAKIKHMRNQYELSPASSLTIEKIDTLSLASFEADESPVSIVDCQQIICSSWIHGTCANKQCNYQHPKIVVKPILIKRAPIKENDKVFLREMNPLEFITTFHCDACSSIVHLSNLHIVDDWHCTSCCQTIMILTKPDDILTQLINIWHHTYKRYIMTQNIAIGNRTSEVLKSLLKCTEALQAKLTSESNIQLELLRIVGRHILMVFSDTGHSYDFISFIKTMDYDIDLVLFVMSLPFPADSVHKLIFCVIDNQISQCSINSIELLIKRYCQWSDYVEESPLPALFQWLEISIKRNITNQYNDAIDALTKSLLSVIIGSSTAFVLDLSVSDLQNDEKYWHDRKDHITGLVRLYKSNRTIHSSIGMVLHKYLILTQFFTDNEENAIELCRQFGSSHFYFQILLSKLSLKYNYPITIGDCNIVTFIEHSYNKSEWLLRNRSEKSCTKILEIIANKLYIDGSGNEALHYYQRFLGLDQSFDSINSNLVPTNTDLSAKSIRESSSIWMCYVNLSVLNGNVDNLSSLLKSDNLLEMDCNHLCRVVRLIFDHFGVIYENETYFELLKSAFQRIQKNISFEHFLDLFNSISFIKLRHSQLAMWLFLVDFCVGHFSDEDKDLFLIEISSKLLRSCDESMRDYDIFTHIVLCYPIKPEKVWLNLIQLILNLNLPLYTLNDVCGSAVSSCKYSKSLWRHYYNCATKIDDTQLITDVKDNAAKMGFSLL